MKYFERSIKQLSVDVIAANQLFTNKNVLKIIENMDLWFYFSFTFER